MVQNTLFLKQPISKGIKQKNRNIYISPATSKQKHEDKTGARVRGVGLNNLGHGGDELLAIVDGFKLFGNGHFVEAVGRRDEDVHLRRLGRNHFRVERFLAEIHLATVGFGYRDRRNHSFRLNLVVVREGQNESECLNFAIALCGRTKTGIDAVVFSVSSLRR